MSKRAHLQFVKSSVTFLTIPLNPIHVVILPCVGVHQKQKGNTLTTTFLPLWKAIVRLMDATGANITHKDAKQRSQCQTHWSVCAGAEIFRGLKTVAAVRVHIHHRGDCCVCPEEGLVCVWADCKVTGLGGWRPARRPTIVWTLLAHAHRSVLLSLQDSLPLVLCTLIQVQVLLTHTILFFYWFVFY